MGRIEAGEIAPEDVAAHMTGLADMIGTPPDLMTNLQSHFDRELPSEFAVEADTQSEAEAEQPPRQRQALAPFSRCPRRDRSTSDSGKIAQRSEATLGGYNQTQTVPPMILRTPHRAAHRG